MQLGHQYGILCLDIAQPRVGFGDFTIGLWREDIDVGRQGKIGDQTVNFSYRCGVHRIQPGKLIGAVFVTNDIDSSEYIVGPNYW